LNLLLEFNLNKRIALFCLYAFTRLSDIRRNNNFQH